MGYPEAAPRHRWIPALVRALLVIILLFATPGYPEGFFYLGLLAVIAIQAVRWRYWGILTASLCLVWMFGGFAREFALGISEYSLGTARFHNYGMPVPRQHLGDPSIDRSFVDTETGCWVIRDMGCMLDLGDPRLYSTRTHGSYKPYQAAVRLMARWRGPMPTPKRELRAGSIAAPEPI